MTRELYLRRDVSTVSTLGTTGRDGRRVVLVAVAASLEVARSRIARTERPNIRSLVVPYVRAAAADRVPEESTDMNTTVVVLVAALLGAQTAAQEEKPVPKDSVRVFVPGCSRGVMFTAGRRTEDQPGGSAVPEGMHLRMAGPKKLMADIKGQEGSRIEITGLMKRGQMRQDGVGIGGGVRVTPGPSPTAGGFPPSPGASQIMIDVEGWRRIPGDCPSH